MVILLFVAPSPRAHAQSVRIVGVGATSCRDFLSDITTEPQRERDYLAWMQGYMSGLLVRSPPGKDEDLNLQPPSVPLMRQADFLQAYCRMNADSQYSVAVQTLYRSLRTVRE
jgi:hypothetical protein